MLLDQLVDFLQHYRDQDHDQRACEAILEWALSNEVGDDMTQSAQMALQRIPAAQASPALEAFRDHLRIAACGLPAPRRRGGSAGRRAIHALAA